MKTKGNPTANPELNTRDQIGYQLGALLKRRIITAALTLGYWA